MTLGELRAQLARWSSRDADEALVTFYVDRAGFAPLQEVTHVAMVRTAEVDGKLRVAGHHSTNPADLRLAIIVANPTRKLELMLPEEATP